MRGINNGGFTITMECRDRLAGFIRRITQDLKMQEEQMQCCDWAPVELIEIPPLVKPAKVPYFNDWSLLGKVESPAEPKYFSPFAPIE